MKGTLPIPISYLKERDDVHTKSVVVEQLRELRGSQ